MAVINIPASKSLTLTNKIPTGNIQDKKIIVGSEGKYTYFSYLFFDMNGIAGDIVVLSAVLVLFKLADFFNSPTQRFLMNPLREQFSSFSTYENDCLIDTDPELKREFLPFTKKVAIEIDITTIFRKWLENTLVNRGVVIKDGVYTKPCILSHTCFGSAYNKDNMLIPFIRVHFKSNSAGILPVPNLTYTAMQIPEQTDDYNL